MLLMNERVVACRLKGVHKSICIILNALTISESLETKSHILKILFIFVKYNNIKVEFKQFGKSTIQ